MTIHTVYLTVKITPLQVKSNQFQNNLSKVLEYLILTEEKYFPHNIHYRLKYALFRDMAVKNCNVVEKLGKTGRGNDLCAGISWKNLNN